MKEALRDILDPDAATVEHMETTYQDAQASANRDGAEEMSFRDGFRAGWKAALKMVRDAAGIELT